MSPGRRPVLTTVRLPVTITAWEDDEPWPGLVRCELIDAGGRRHPFVEKVAVVTADPLGSDGPYPHRGEIAARVVGTEGGVLRVDTVEPWGITSIDGRSVFEVDELAVGVVDVRLPDAGERVQEGTGGPVGAGPSDPVPKGG